MLQEACTPNSLGEYIKEELKRQAISANELCRSTVLSYGTIYRVLTKGRELRPFEFLEIARVLFDKSKTKELIEKFYSSYNDELLITLEKTSKTDSLDDNFDVFTNERTFQIANLIQVGYFKSLPEVHNAFGDIGIKVLKNMSESGLVKFDSKQNIEITNNKLRPNINVVKKQISNSLKFHKIENCGQGKNYAYFGSGLKSSEERRKIQKFCTNIINTISCMIHSGNVPDENIKEITRTLTEYNKIDKTADKTEPIFISLAMDDFLEENGGKL